LKRSAYLFAWSFQDHLKRIWGRISKIHWDYLCRILTWVPFCEDLMDLLPWNKFGISSSLFQSH
jgi:hypothetical protein